MQLYVIIQSRDVVTFDACNATHGIALSVLSVHLSVRCVYCDKTKQSSVSIPTPYKHGYL